ECRNIQVDQHGNGELTETNGIAPERLPKKLNAHSVHDKALKVDWENLLPQVEGMTYLFGNPPFLGQDTRSKEQLEELQRVWGRKNISRLDYVTAWHVKAAKVLDKRLGAFAFVTTTSITQGE